MTEPGGPAWRQTIFYPFAAVARSAKKGVVLQPRLDSCTHETNAYGQVKTINAVAVRGCNGNLEIFATNRSLTDDVEFTIQNFDENQPKVILASTLHEDDLHAKNTLRKPDRVTMHTNNTVSIEGKEVSITLPKASWTHITIK